VAKIDGRVMAFPYIGELASCCESRRAEYKRNYAPRKYDAVTGEKLREFMDLTAAVS
jgi:hypothetical protein